MVRVLGWQWIWCGIFDWLGSCCWVLKDPHKAKVQILGIVMVRGEKGGGLINSAGAQESHGVAQTARWSTCGVQLTGFQRTIPLRWDHREIGGGGKQERGEGAGGGGVSVERKQQIFFFLNPPSSVSYRRRGFGGSPYNEFQMLQRSLESTDRNLEKRLAPLHPSRPPSSSPHNEQRRKFHTEITLSSGVHHHHHHDNAVTQQPSASC